MIYVSRNELNEIYSYGDTPDAAAVVVDEVDISMDEYAARCVLSVDSQTVIANSSDEAIVTVSTNLQDVAAITLRLFEQYPNIYTDEEVTLVDGVGTIGVSLDAPGVIIIHPADLTVYAAAGVGTVVIRGEEIE